MQIPHCVRDDTREILFAKAWETCSMFSSGCWRGRLNEGKNREGPTLKKTEDRVPGTPCPKPSGKAWSTRLAPRLQTLSERWATCRVCMSELKAPSP
jgi:hypothetical protein